MAQSNLLELAKQGDPQAIAILMNRTLQPKGITAHTTLQGDRLRVLLEAEQVPNRQAMTTFVRHGISSLGVTTIREIEIIGRQTGDDRSAWTQEVYLGMPVATSESPPETPRPVPIPATAPPPPPRPSHLRLVPPPPTPLPPPESRTVDSATAPPDSEHPADLSYQVIDQPAPLIEAQPVANELQSTPKLEVVSSAPPEFPERDEDLAFTDEDPALTVVQEPPAIEADPFSPEELDLAKPRRSRRGGAIGVAIVLVLMLGWIGAIIGYALWKELNAPSPQPAPTTSPAAMQTRFSKA